MWLIYSQISALAETSGNLLAKKLMDTYDSTVLTWLWVVCSTFFLGLFTFFMGIPEIQPVFFTIFALRILFDTVALLLFTKAIQLEDLSYIAPLFNFSAVFSLFFSFLINKELPSLLGIFGVLLIISGAYMLNFDNKNSNYFHPLINIWKSRASLMMLCSTMLYGVIFSISKVGIDASSWSFYTFASAAGLSVSIFPIAYFMNKKDLLKILQPQNFIKVLPLGFIDAIKILALMATIQTSYVGFADASNNTSTLYNQFFAKVFLKEKVDGRVIPVVLMFAGLLCIVLFN